MSRPIPSPSPAPALSHSTAADLKAADAHIDDIDYQTSKEAEAGLHGSGHGKSAEVYEEAAAMGQMLSGYEGLGIIDTIRTFRRAFLFCFMAAFAAACDGYQIGMNSGVLANVGFTAQFATEINAAGKPILSAPVLTAIGTIQSVGQIIAMVSMPFVAARFGRKWAMYGCWSFLVISVLSESLARVWQIWFVGKLFSGIGVGTLQFVSPVYISEMAPPRVRGFLLLCYSLWFSTGGLMANIALTMLSRVAPTDWLTPVYTQWAQIGLMICIYLVLPESPAWCATKHGARDAQGKKMLARIYQGVPNYDVDYQYSVLQRMVEHEEEVARTAGTEAWYNIFKGVNFKRTMVSCWTLLSQQFLGLTLFSTYTTYFFRIAGIADPFQASVIQSGVGLASIVLSVLIVDRVGRRVLCCSALTLMFLMNGCIGVLGVVPRTDAVSQLLLLFAMLWSVGTAVTGATGWGYLGETSSQRLRAHTAGFGAATSCVMGVVMNVLVPYMLNENAWNWNLKTGFFYFAIGAPYAIGSWFVIPETKGRTSAELDELFESGVKPWRFHKTETATQKAHAASKRDEAGAVAAF